MQQTCDCKYNDYFCNIVALTQAKINWNRFISLLNISKKPFDSRNLLDIKIDLKPELRMENLKQIKFYGTS
jgi:hypothetical protein